MLKSSQAVRFWKGEVFGHVLQWNSVIKSCVGIPAVLIEFTVYGIERSSHSYSEPYYLI